MTIYYKTCCECKETKAATEFYKNKTKKDGLQSRCKVCVKIYKKEYTILNEDKVKEWNKRREESESRKEYRANYQKNNREKNKAYQKVYYQNNKEKAKKYNEEYRKKNKDQQNQTAKEYARSRRASDSMYALIGRLRCLIGRAFRNKGYTKKSKTHEILGCSYEDFKSHIENQFLEGMSWENRGEWHLDHKIPVSWGISEEEIVALNHYTNFQPLWRLDNIVKSNKYVG